MSAAAVVISLGAVGLNQINNNERVNDIQELAVDNTTLLSTIQAERRANILAACEDRNAANKRVRKELTKLTVAQAKAEGGGSTPKLQREQRVTIRKISNAIHKPQNCAAVVKKQTGKSQATK
jgi:hypothetical protein